MNTTTRANDMIVVASRLIALMEQEIEILRNMKIREIETLQVEKDQLANAYLEHSRTLRQEPAQMRALAPAIREELTQALGRLQDVFGRNERALRAAREANGRLIQAVVDAIAEKQGNATTYTNAGKVSRCATCEAGPTPLTLNREL